MVSIWNMKEAIAEIAKDPAVVARSRHNRGEVIVIHSSNSDERARLVALYGEPDVLDALLVFKVS